MTANVSNITSGFIDIATFDELEKYMYGGRDATTYFVREVRTSTWFTQIPVPLSRINGNGTFGTECLFNVSRSGDYLLQAWLRVELPEVSLSAGNVAGENGRIRWTRNLMHNLVEEAFVTFNDLQGCRFDNYVLDFWNAFTIDESKYNGYENMIGNVSSLIQPKGPGQKLPATVLSLPLLFFFSRDSGVALPTAALPYNEIHIKMKLRHWRDLLIFENASLTKTNQKLQIIPTRDLNAAPELMSCQVWANYAIVSNEERKRMGCSVRDILIENFQTIPTLTLNPKMNPSFDLRLSHSIKALFWGVRNTTSQNEWSNYSTASPITTANQTNFVPDGAYDPLMSFSLRYENQYRLADMGSDFFSLIFPYFGAPRIPKEIGYHMYSYSLNFHDLDPKGSTNFGKLTNVSCDTKSSPAAVLASDGSGEAGADFPQTFQFVLVAVNNNIIRISGGALGFPVL
jgi:hypothetical protein